MISVCRFSGLAATSSCGQIQMMPFLAGTEPKPDGFHSKGCFDIVAMVASDDRRPQQWVESAQRWADRFVNGETGGKGDPSKMSTLGPDKVWLSIAPVPGNRGFGNTICGQRRFTPQPSATPGSSERRAETLRTGQCPTEQQLQDRSRMREPVQRAHGGGRRGGPPATRPAVRSSRSSAAPLVAGAASYLVASCDGGDAGQALTLPPVGRASA